MDLHTLKVLTGIATQGAISKETQKAYYVTTFKLEVSTNGEDWMVYRHGKNHKVGWESCTDPPLKIIWMLLGDTRFGKIRKMEYVHHMSWPQTTNLAVDCNYSLSTILHLASIRALLPSQIQQIAPSDTLHRDFGYILDLLFSSHLVSVTDRSEFCLVSTTLGEFFGAVSLHWRAMNHQHMVPAEVDGRNEVSDNKALLRWLQLKSRNVHVAVAAFSIIAVLLLL